MKRLILISFLALFLTGCERDKDKDCKITFFPPNGEPIVYRGVEDYSRNGTKLLIHFLNGTRVRLQGDYEISETKKR